MVSDRSERGYALLLALVAGSVVLAAMALVAATLQHRMGLLRQESRVIHLAALADAGLAQALAELSINRGYGGAGEQSFGGGSFEIGVLPIDDQDVLVTVRTSYGGGRRAITALVRLYETAPPRVLSWRPVATEGS